MKHGSTIAHHTHHTIAIQQVEQILLGVQARGWDVAPLLARADIPLPLLDSPLARVTQTQYAALLRSLRHDLRDELWGLCEQPLPLGSFAQACRMLIACRTLGEAMAMGLRYYRLLLSDFTPRLHVQPDLTSLRLVPRRPFTPSLYYGLRCFSFFSYGLASWLVARRIPLKQVEYPRGWPSSSSDAGALFQAPFREGSTWMGWTCETRWLELPVVQNEQSLAAFMRQAPANLVVRYRDETSLSERIRRILRSHLAEELPSLDAIGRQLAMTPQTVRRRLREEGLGFRAIKDDLRRDAAIEYLARPDLTLHDVASLLGFSEASTFHRAFKAWTGVAPGEYRKAHLQHPLTPS